MYPCLRLLDELAEEASGAKPGLYKEGYLAALQEARERMETYLWEIGQE